MSQFKKPKGFNSRSPSPMQSNRDSKVKSNHRSNQSGNYMNELRNANQKNQDLMASLLNDGVFEAHDQNSLDNPTDVLFDNGGGPFIDQVDLRLVGVDANDSMPVFCQTPCRDRPNITEAKNTDVHAQ